MQLGHHIRTAKLIFSDERMSAFSGLFIKKATCLWNVHAIKKLFLKFTLRNAFEASWTYLRVIGYLQDFKIFIPIICMRKKRKY